MSGKKPNERQLRKESPPNGRSVSARVNKRAMWQLAKNYAPDMLILEPKRLANQV